MAVPLKDFRSSRRDRLVASAQQAVYDAIREGKLAPATTKKCADCGAPAECYDHRDYTQPLKVEAVCKGCNNRRGPGWPKPEGCDGLIHKHGVKNIGEKWSGLEGGEGFAPLEAKLVDGFTTQDLDDALVAIKEAERMRASVAHDDNLRRVTSTVFSTGKQGGIRNVVGIARAEYFKRRDPWHA